MYGMKIRVTKNRLLRKATDEEESTGATQKRIFSLGCCKNSIPIDFFFELRRALFGIALKSNCFFDLLSSARLALRAAYSSLFHGLPTDIPLSYQTSQPTDNETNEISYLEKLKKFHQEQEKLLYERHLNGGSGKEITRCRAEMIDHIVKNIFIFFSCSKKQLAQKLCIIGCGGYGRHEMNPYSDVDIMFLYEEKELILEREQIISSILMTLWDFGLKVGHSTRSLSHALEHANQDSISKTAMMECRLLAGDKKIFQKFKRRFRKKCILGQEKEYITWRFENMIKLREKFGKSVFMQEPNIKSGSGGLRDYQNLIWISHYYHQESSLSYLMEKKFLKEDEKKVLEYNYDFLLRVRSCMHYQEKRAQDQLTLRLQGKVATQLGYSQQNMIRRSEAFMKNYYESTRDIYLITSAVLARMNPINRKKKSLTQYISGFLDYSESQYNIFGLRIFSIWNRKKEMYNECVIKKGFLYPEPSGAFSHPAGMMKAFYVAQAESLQFSSELCDLFKKNLYRINDHFRKSSEIRNIFLNILSRKGEVGRILRLMHDLGFLGKYIPEFGALTCLVQHEFYHLYTADEHTLVCLEKIDSLFFSTNKKFLRYSNLFKELDDPAMLYLGMLLHDTGKAANVPDHAQASMTMAEKIAHRWNLSEERSSLLLTLVKLHGELAKVARTRDLDDYTTIVEFANKIKKNLTRRFHGTHPLYEISGLTLDALIILTLADGMGTSDSQWSDWKEQLVWHLYDQTKKYLELGKTFFEKNQYDYNLLKGLVQEMLPADFQKEIEVHFEHMPERYFRMMEPHSIKEHVQLIRLFFEHRINIDSQKEHLLGAEIFWKENAASGYTEVVICGWDQERLLERVAASFLKAGINILSADIFTRRDHISLDIFRVTSVRTDPLLTQKEKKIMEKHLQELLELYRNKLDRIFYTDCGKRVVKPKEVRKKGSLICYSSHFQTHTIGSHEKLKLDQQFVQYPIDLKKISDHEENQKMMPIHLLIDNQSHPTYTIVEVEAPDREGLFYDLVGALCTHDISIDCARIATELRAAFDTFYILGGNQKKVTDQETLKILHQRLNILVTNKN